MTLKKTNISCRTRRVFLTALCLVAWAPTPAVARNPKEDQARAALDHAMAMSNLWAEGGPSFHLKAMVRLFQGEGKFVAGTYQSIRVGPNQSRSELVLPHYSATTIVTPTTVWSVRSQDYVPYSIERLLESFHVGWHWRGEKKNQIKKVVELEDNGIKMTCAQISAPMHVLSEYCYDTSSGNLVSESQADADSVSEYREFFSWEGKVYPRLILTYRGKELVCTARVEELTTEPHPDPALFLPPTGTRAQSWPNCDEKEGQRPKLVAHSNPEYPAKAKSNGVTGNVVLYAEIGLDGYPHELAVKHSAGPDLDEAALKSVPQWKFQPASCKGVPIVSTNDIMVHFVLGQ